MNLPTFVLQVAPQGADRINIRVLSGEYDAGTLILSARDALYLLNILDTASGWFGGILWRKYDKEHRFFVIDWINDFNRRRLAEMYIRSGVKHEPQV